MEHKSFFLLIFFSLLHESSASEGVNMTTLLNSHQITENITTSGQPTAEQFLDLAKADYTAVINLATFSSPSALIEEDKIITELGMLYVHIPVDWEEPKIGDLKVFFEVMEVLDGQKVLVHCAMNYRVSAFMYKYLTLIKGVSSRASASPILRSWEPSMSDGWKYILALKKDDF
jgi:protein tyrosine phosphatase (PTP) superfamily phosphohydrolase (DUF442 family)